MSIREMVDSSIAKQMRNKGFLRLWIHKDSFIVTQDQIEEINLVLAELYANNPTPFELDHLSLITETLKSIVRASELT